MKAKADIEINTKGTRRLLTPQEAATYLGTTVATLASWRCTGAVKIGHVKLGKAVRYSIEDLEAFIAGNRVSMD